MHPAQNTKVRHYADGGLISKFLGGAKTVAPTQAQQQTAAPLVKGALDPKNALKSREEAAGLAKGGKVPGKSPSATADNIPIMATAGEFMIKKKAADMLGPKVLRALNAVADGPGAKKAPKAGMRAAGAIQKKAAGDYIYNEYRAPVDEMGTPGGGQSAVKPVAQVVQPAPAQINAPAYTTSPGAAAPTNAIKYAMPPEPIAATTSPGAAPVQPSLPPGPRAAPQSAVKFSGDPLYPNSQGPAPSRPQTPPTPITGGPTIPGTAPARPDAVMRGAGFTIATPKAPPTMGAQAVQMLKASGNPALGAAALIPEQIDVARVAANPNATKVDVATQQFQGFGRFGAAGAGALTGAAVGAPLGPFGSAVGAVAGGALGYYAADKAIEGGRNLVGTDPRAPVDRLPAAGALPAAPAPAVAAPYPETVGNRQLASQVSPQAVAESVANPSNPAGAVTRIGNSYSGAPGISGDISINGKTPKGGFVSGTGDGTFTYGGTGGGSGGGGGVSDQALSAARMAAAQRGDVEGIKASYAAQGQDFGPKVNAVDALMNNGKPMTAKKAAAIAALQASATGAETAKASGAIAAKKAGAETEGLTLDNKGKARLGALQDKVANAKTPAEQVAAEDKLRAFQGKYEKPVADEYAYAPGGQVVDPATGTVTTQPGVIFNKRNGETRSGPAAAAKTYEMNKVYVDGKGNRAKWDGKQFVPA